MSEVAAVSECARAVSAGSNGSVVCMRPCACICCTRSTRYEVKAVVEEDEEKKVVVAVVAVAVVVVMVVV